MAVDGAQGALALRLGLEFSITFLLLSGKERQEPARPVSQWPPLTSPSRSSPHIHTRPFPSLLSRVSGSQIPADAQSLPSVLLLQPLLFKAATPLAEVAPARPCLTLEVSPAISFELSPSQPRLLAVLHPSPFLSWC